MAVVKIFTGDVASECSKHELRVEQDEKKVWIDIDMKDIPPSHIVLDLSTLTELIKELNKIEKSIINGKIINGNGLPF